MSATMYVDLASGPDERDRFQVFQGAAALRLDLDTIKWHIANGDRVEEMPATRG